MKIIRHCLWLNVEKPLEMFNSFFKRGEGFQIFEISDVMTHDVKYVYADTPLDEVKKIILTENRGGLPVLSHREEVVGMITRRSVLDYLVRTG